MRIHDTKELRLRATSHAKWDHVKQGTYGNGKVNGKTEFHGCAVGCLSTPHRKRDLRNFLKENLSNDGDWLRLDDFAQRKLLSEEFGINPILATAAEGFFEAQPTHGAAINFIKDFAYALVEGSDIKPSEVRDYAKTRLNGCQMGDEGGYQAIWNCVRNVIEDPQVATEDFLKWLRSRKPAKA